MKVVTGNGEFDLGTTEATPTIGMTDFSRRVTDDFGVTTVVERGFSRRMSVKLGLPFDTVDAVHRRLSDLRASPALWVADDRYVWLSLYGFYKDFDVDLAVPPLSRVTLTIDGLAETGGVTDIGADPAIGQASTLQLLQPAPVTNAMLAASTVAENDAAEWSGSVGYGKGARVIRASTHRVYESLITGNVGRAPESEPAWWLDVGPTNRWAMFDQALGTATTRNGGVEVTLNGGTANAVSLIHLVGDTVRVRANGYDQTQPVRPGAITFTGLPGSGQVTVTVSGAQAAVGTLLIGRMVGLGVTEAAPTAGITDFSRKVTDDFGAVAVVERGYSKRMTARALIRSDAVDVVADRLASVRARPSLWIGQSGVDAITVYGFVKDFEIEVGTSASKLSLTVEGLTKAAPAAVGVPQLVPRGPYDPATIYAAGALVEDQGVTWRYINVTPTSGYAPPKLPTTRNGFWQVFSSVGMTPEQQAAYDRLLAAITAITSDNIIAAGGEKNQIIQLYQQVSDLSGRAHTASGGLVTTYGVDPTYDERNARDHAMLDLNTFLGRLGPPNWNDVTGDTPVDGAEMRRLFADAQSTANALMAAADAYVSSRTKGVIDRANAIGSDNVLSSGSEKQQVVIDWNTLYQDLESLYAKYVELGSPADLATALSDATAARTALGTYLGGLNPPWNQIGIDTPIVSADWSANWTNAYQRINDLRAKIAGRKGDKGDTGPSLLVSATPQVIRFSADGVIFSGPVTFRADLANLSGTVTWRSQIGHGLFNTAGVTFSGNTMTISAERMRDVLAYNEAQTGVAAETIIGELNGVSHRVTVTKQVDGSVGLAGPGGFSHLAYANSADGTVDFHTSNAAGRMYLGSYTDQIEADSNDPARYTWTLIKGADGKDSTVPGPAGVPALNLTASVSSLTFTADYLSNVKSGQLAQVVVFTFTEGPNNVSTSVDWTVPEFSGCQGSMTSAGLVTFTSVSATGYVRVTGTYKGVSFTSKVPITLAKDAPPANSDQQASVGIGRLVTSLSYSGAPDATVVASIPSGTLRCRFDIAYSPDGRGNVYLEGMLGYRRAGTSDAWNYLPAVQGTQGRIGGSASEPIDEQGTASANQTANVGVGRWEVGFFVRRYQGGLNGNYSGTLQGGNG